MYTVYFYFFKVLYIDIYADGLIYRFDLEKDLHMRRVSKSA